MGKLEDALRRAAELVVSCGEKRYLCMVAILSMVAIKWDNALFHAYLDQSLRDALEAERSKLQIEHSSSDDAERRRLIEHLIGVTDSAANDWSSRKVKKLLVNESAYVISG
ncbi:hypothetical protein CRG98_020745 [Punica granatum]|uniref:Uncharacterized protein n=1 Tax=Punica granatum TaxID=22663 RepID=A0A2I0JTQ8_PUNGR|nr:hypothetical protein CRG98_020745 [Punica granatum]